MEALSDSTVIKLCSAFTVSPTLTNSSMTATSSKSPMSGTLISTNAMVQPLKVGHGGSRQGFDPSTH